MSPADQPAPPPPRLTFRARIRNRWNQLRDWWRRIWSNIRPGPEAYRGAVWAIIAAAAWAAVVAGRALQSGFGLWIDFPFAIAVAAIGVPLIAVIVALLLTIFRRLPRLRSGFIFGACLFIALVFFPVGPVLGVGLGLVEGALGATIATFFFGNFRQAALSKKIITVVLCAAAIAANVELYIFLSSDGEMENF